MKLLIFLFAVANAGYVKFIDFPGEDTSHAFVAGENDVGFTYCMEQSFYNIKGLSKYSYSKYAPLKYAEKEGAPNGEETAPSPSKWYNPKGWFGPKNRYPKYAPLEYAEEKGAPNGEEAAPSPSKWYNPKGWFGPKNRYPKYAPLEYAEEKGAPNGEEAAPSPSKWYNPKGWFAQRRTEIALFVGQVAYPLQFKAIPYTLYRALDGFKLTYSNFPSKTDVTRLMPSAKEHPAVKRDILMGSKMHKDDKCWFVMLKKLGNENDLVKNTRNDWRIRVRTGVSGFSPKLRIWLKRKMKPADRTTQKEIAALGRTIAKLDRRHEYSFEGASAAIDRACAASLSELYPEEPEPEKVVVEEELI